MAKRRKKKAKRSSSSPGRRRRYSPVELIIAGVGALLLAFVIGMIISSMLTG